MDEGSLSHTKWECKYHVVFIPKYRRKALYGDLRRYLGEVFRALARQRESRIEEGHLMPDHVHMMISIPPKRLTQRFRWRRARIRCSSLTQGRGAHPALAACWRRCSRSSS